MHWVGRDSAGLHLFTPTHPIRVTPRCADPGHRAGDRRRLCNTVAGLRAHPGAIADAGDRAVVLLVVSVALAVLVFAPVVVGHPLGLVGICGSGPRLRALGMLTLRFL